MWVLNTSIVLAQEFFPVQSEAGINHYFKHTTFLGGGAAFFDFDNDGDDDLYITSGDEMDHFYINNGDGTFSDNTFLSGFINTKLYYTMGVVAGDVDNDGFQDLFVTTEYSDFSSPAKNLLFRNNGDGTFIDIWPFDDNSANKLSVGAIMLDVNNDSFLDIYVLNYIESTSFPMDSDGNIIGFDHECYTNNLYINNGDLTFDDKSAIYGVADKGCALAAVPSDFDNDGDTDIYLANDFGEFVIPNRLYRNNTPSNQFTEISNATGSDIPLYGMGIASGDVDHDLDIDYYVTNYGKNVLLVNDDGNFSEKAEEFGIDDTYTTGDSLLAIGWGAEFLDIDNDSDLDLYIGNGYVPGPDFIPSELYMNDRIYLNNGNAEFEEIGQELGIDNKFTTRGVSYSDFDLDGDLDILAIVLNVPMNGEGWQTILYENRMDSIHNWIQFELQGSIINRDAYGSRVFIYTDEGQWLQELVAGGSHASMHTNIIHFGLENMDNIDSVKVIWTGGKEEVFYDFNINERHLIVESNEMVSSVAEQIQTNSVVIYPNPADGYINFNTKESSSLSVISLYNSEGKEILNEEFNQLIGPYQVNISSLPNGLYFAKIKSKLAHYEQKLLIQRF